MYMYSFARIISEAVYGHECFAEFFLCIYSLLLQFLSGIKEYKADDRINFCLHFHGQREKTRTILWVKIILSALP